MKHFFPTPTPAKQFIPLYADNVPAGFPSPAVFPYGFFINA
ncbi:Uncharacterised protein [Serratia quinivorans]|nr:Uncharacterised protein [Serratia quinivorans]